MHQTDPSQSQSRSSLCVSCSSSVLFVPFGKEKAGIEIDRPGDNRSEGRVIPGIPLPHQPARTTDQRSGAVYSTSTYRAAGNVRLRPGIIQSVASRIYSNFRCKRQRHECASYPVSCTTYATGGESCCQHRENPPEAQERLPRVKNCIAMGRR